MVVPEYPLEFAVSMKAQLPQHSKPDPEDKSQASPSKGRGTIIQFSFLFRQFVFSLWLLLSSFLVFSVL